MRTDGSELHRLLGPEDLVSLTGNEAALFIYNVDWIPSSHKILFNTEKVIQGTPGSIPLFDLFHRLKPLCEHRPLLWRRGSVSAAKVTG